MLAYIHILWVNLKLSSNGRITGVTCIYIYIMGYIFLLIRPFDKSFRLTGNIYIYIYRCPRRNVPDIWRVFLTLKYTDITQNTYIQSWTVTEIMVREKSGLLAVPNTATCTADTSRDNASVLEGECSVHCGAWRFAQSAMLRHRWAFSYIVLVTLRILWHECECFCSSI